MRDDIPGSRGAWAAAPAASQDGGAGGGPVPVEPPAPGRSWTVLHLVRWSAAYLEEKGVPSSRLDAELLLAHALGLSRLDLYLQHDRPLAPEELAAFRALLLERARRKPLQYVLGSAAFRDLELGVDRRVLIPRPETEGLVERVLQRFMGGSELEALDVGTGSGAIALSLSLEGPFRRVVATDLSEDALQVARANALALEVEGVEFRAGSLFHPVGEGERFHLVVSNPPYVERRTHRTLEPEVRDWEPESALVAGAAGTEILDPLVDGSPEVLHTGGLLALEVGEGQVGAVADRIRRTPGLGEPEVEKDLEGRSRYVLARRDGSALRS